MAYFTNVSLYVNGYRLTAAGSAEHPVTSEMWSSDGDYCM
jgi:hypothetical protein